MSLYNGVVANSLPTAEKSRVEAYLLEYGTDGGQGKRLWSFLYNPQTLRFSGDTVYQSIGAFASRESDQQFAYTNGLVLEVPDIVFESYCLGKSVRPLLEGIDELRKADIKKSRFNPPILSFLFGSRRFAPCVLTKVSWDESAWLGGEPARVRMNLTFQQIPTPGKLGLNAIAPELKTNALETPLTERQQDEAKKKAKEWLKANLNNIDPQLKTRIEEKDYELTVDANTGEVKLKTGDENLNGIVGRWTGKEFQTDTFNTLKKQTQQTPVQKTESGEVKPATEASATPTPSSAPAPSPSPTPTP